jgi:hypothetical protein
MIPNSLVEPLHGPLGKENETAIYHHRATLTRVLEGYAPLASYGVPLWRVEHCSAARYGLHYDGKYTEGLVV